MKKYTIEELKIAWTNLYNTDSNTMWNKINLELAKRLNKEDYLNFVASH